MRIGEIIGLPISAIHIEEGYLQVLQALYWLPGNKPIIQDPKTDSSKRSISLLLFILDVLQESLERRAGLPKVEGWEDLTFTTNVGTPIEYRNGTKHYKQVIEENELPEIRFHDLRHTVATILLEKRINPKIVQEQLGHGTIKQTMDTYSHVIKSMRDIAANALNQAIAGNQALAGDDEYAQQICLKYALDVSTHWT